MLELLIRLEGVRQALRRGIFGTFGDNDYHMVAGIFALALSFGTVLTGGTILIPATAAIGGISFAIALGAAALAFLVVILIPVALIVL
jgi:hypothetical protein